MQKKVLMLLMLLLSVSLAACEKKRTEVNLKEEVATTPAAVPNDPREQLHIAVAAMISPETTRTYYQDLLTLIADRLGRRAVFSQRRTYAEVNEMVKKKEVDFAFVCAGPYTQGKSDFGMEILAVPVVNGKSVYYSYILAGKSSPIQSFGDLRGKKFAFTDPQSNTGSLVPTYMLARKGETPKKYFSEFFYSNSHDNSIKAVAEGQADGAAVDSLIWEFMNRIDPTFTSRTRIIEKSPPYGIPPIVVHPDLDPETKKRLKEVILNLHNDKQALVLLHKLQIERFTEGKDSMYDTVRDMSKWIEKVAEKK